MSIGYFVDNETAPNVKNKLNAVVDGVNELEETLEDKVFIDSTSSFDEYGILIATTSSSYEILTTSSLKYDFDDEILYLVGDLSVDITSSILKTDASGILSSATADTDYQQVVTWGDGLTYTTGTASVDYNTTNLKITSSKIDTIQSIATTADMQLNKLTLATGSSAGLIFDNDVNLYRDSANVLKTDDAFICASTFICNEIKFEYLNASYAGIRHIDIASSGNSQILFGDDGVLVFNSPGDAKSTDFRANGTNILSFIEDSGTQKMGFFNATRVAKPEVTGSRGSNAALESLCSALSSLGLITNSTS
jgi:hypothetical protein